MNNFKLSSKKVYKDTRSTIENVHNEQINKIENNNKKLQSKKKRLKTLIELASTIKSSYDKYDITNEIDNLKQEIYNIENNIDLIDYLSSALPFLENIDSNDEIEEEKEEEDGKEEEEGIMNFVNKIGKTNKGSKYNNYINTCFKKSISNDCVSNPKCLNCDNTEFIYDSQKNDYICLNCGICKIMIDNTTSAMNYADLNSIEYSGQQFFYQRKNHFKEWLNQLQGLEVTVIPDSVINLIILEIKKERIQNMNDINLVTVKKFLKKLKLTKYYEHIPNIITRITKKPPLNISLEFVNILLDLFDKIQEPFKKHCPPNRKNFLSYSYTLYKFCQLLGKNEYLVLFPLLKSREKLFEQEKIWKNICIELNWKFISSI